MVKFSSQNVVQVREKIEWILFQYNNLEYTCQVEAASFQSTPKVREKEDKYVNTIDDDDHYKAFLAKERIYE